MVKVAHRWRANRCFSISSSFINWVNSNSSIRFVLPWVGRSLIYTRYPNDELDQEKIDFFDHLLCRRRESNTSLFSHARVETYDEGDLMINFLTQGLLWQSSIFNNDLLEESRWKIALYNIKKVISFFSRTTISFINLDFCLSVCLKPFF